MDFAAVRPRRGKLAGAWTLDPLVLAPLAAALYWRGSRASARRGVARRLALALGSRRGHGAAAGGALDLAYAERDRRRARVLERGASPASGRYWGSIEAVYEAYRNGVDDDLFFGPDATQGWFTRFKAGGARAEYVLQPPFGANGHYIFTDAAGVALWLPAVENFLRRHGIPFTPLRTESRAA